MNQNVIIGAAMTIFSGILIDYGNCPGLSSCFSLLTIGQWVRTIYITSKVDNW
jgi:hypothetical protein